jgi:hypothetical protein
LVWFFQSKKPIALHWLWMVIKSTYKMYTHTHRVTYYEGVCQVSPIAPSFFHPITTTPGTKSPSPSLGEPPHGRGSTPMPWPHLESKASPPSDALRAERRRAQKAGFLTAENLKTYIAAIYMCVCVLL